MSNRSLGSLTLDLKANTSQYTEGLSKAERATDDTVKASAAQEKQLQRLQRSLDPTTAKLDQLGKQQAQVTKLFEQGAIDRSTYDKLTAAIDQKRAALTKVEKTQSSYLDGMKRVAGQAAKTAAAVAAIGAAAAAAALGGIAVMTRSSMNEIDAQAKLARSINGTIDGVRSLQIAAGDAGVSGLESSLAGLNRRLGALEMGGGPAAKTVERLGLNLERLRDMDVDERVAHIADRIRDSGMSAQEAARHLQQLGFTQAGVTELFMQGGDAIRDARQELEDYGLSVDMADAAVIEAANDQLSRVGRLLEGVRTTLAVELSPYILEIASRFNAAARASGGMGSMISSAVESSVRGVAALIDWVSRLWHGFQRGKLIIAEMELLFAQFARNSWGYISSFVDSWVNGINQIIRGMNTLGASMRELERFSESDWIRRFDDQLSVALGRRNLAALDVSEPTNFTGHLDEFLESIRKRREELGQTASNLPIFSDSDVETGERIANATKNNTDKTDEFARSLQSLEDTLFPLEVAQRRYREQQEILNRALIEGRIELDRYDEAMKRLEESQRNLQGPESVYGSIFNPSGSSGPKKESELQKFMREAEETFENFESMSASVASNFGQSFSTQFSRILSQAESPRFIE
ncbi:hypothetical protein HOP61_13265 [Halomonas daqingensis]|uniref:Uncharacterized protein n=1 Tax=Billgrantia desiderata TaxID=52021 RepID=A0AAW4YVJ7_9GAMM|nr:hypothetical protein [Halomonas desiderata]MCE8052274.1 hypothetical protein [Halomonas desiderata]